MLTRDFKETVKERAARDPAFAKAMLDDAATAVLNGEPHVARLILRDLVNASVGFELEKTWTHDDFGKPEVSETWRLRL